MRVEAEVWADLGIRSLLNEHVRTKKPYTVDEVEALLRAAYGLGYMEALGGTDRTDAVDAAAFYQALRLSLPLT